MKILWILATALLIGLPTVNAQDVPKQKPQADKFELFSSAFKQGEDIPSKYSCEGGDINPPLEMKNIPSKTQSLALTIHDPDAPEGTWVHWVVYNIPPSKTVIEENSIPGYQSLNDFGKYNYGGPCPSNEKAHHYIFRAYALNTILDIDEGMTMKDLERAMNGHVVAKSELVGIYRKPVW